ncbi:uncharacterized protein SAPINGB_P000596 [Magnusiomyces paraingens]|uniref:CNH domain-containing protein n=1 Tax=Magnusiomyces paraingens TaxID=2606893 RepID=A0A5E8B0F8_9ASCO|nr:uncharacterized protein SAPINGB_P000596 [Saprochaete ingens]VVT44974.1 unnamed protein product [Saprochaete ingens]
MDGNSHFNNHSSHKQPRPSQSIPQLASQFQATSLHPTSSFNFAHQGNFQQGLSPQQQSPPPQQQQQQQSPPPQQQQQQQQHPQNSLQQQQQQQQYHNPSATAAAAAAAAAANASSSATSLASTSSSTSPQRPLGPSTRDTAFTNIFGFSRPQPSISGPASGNGSTTTTSDRHFSSGNNNNNSFGYSQAGTFPDHHQFASNITSSGGSSGGGGGAMPLSSLPSPINMSQIPPVPVTTKFNSAYDESMNNRIYANGANYNNSSNTGFPRPNRSESPAPSPFSVPPGQQQQQQPQPQPQPQQQTFYSPPPIAQIPHRPGSAGPQLQPAFQQQDINRNFDFASANHHRQQQQLQQFAHGGGVPHRPSLQTSHQYGSLPRSPSLPANHLSAQLNQISQNQSQQQQQQQQHQQPRSASGGNMPSHVPVPHAVRPPASQYNPNVIPALPAPSTRSMSLTSASRPSGPMDRDLHGRSQTMTLSGRIIPRRQGIEMLPHLHPNTASSSGNNTNQRSTSTGSASSSTSLVPIKGVKSKNQRSTSTSSRASEEGVSLSDPAPMFPSPSSHGSPNSSFSRGTPFPAPTTIITTSRRSPLVKPAFLSKVAQAFQQRIVLRDRVKNELTYTKAFTGIEAIDLICYIIQSTDRNMALLLGRALDAQKLFHDVTYEHRLRDRPDEVYQFNEIMVEREEDEHGHMSNSLSNSVTSISSMNSITATTTGGTLVNAVIPNTGTKGAVSSHAANERANSVSSVNQHQGQQHQGHPEHSKKSEATSVPVNGIFVLLTKCYSPTCRPDRLCYSVGCPKRLEQQARLNIKPNSVLKRAESRLSLHGDDEKEHKLWIHTVSKDIVDSVSDKEKKRQEVICELIYTERDFVKDLEYLRDFWIKPLQVGNIIPESRRKSFLNQVFGVIPEVHAVNIKLADALTKRQQQAPIVDQVGDIFLEYVPKFKPFIEYGKKQVYAKYVFEGEKSNNSAFAKFVDETERKKESRKLELNGYLTKPTTRLARYPLLLDAILKATDDSNPDKENLPKARTLVREFLTQLNIESGRSENRQQLMQLNNKIQFRPNERVDLKLTDESRQIIFKGTMKKRTGDKENQGDVLIYLFDNSLLFLRPKIVNKRENLNVYRKPIPLELLVINESDEAPPKGATRRTSSSLISTAAKVAPLKENAQNRYPIMFQHLGRRGYELILYTSSYISRKKWVENIMDQKKVLIEKSDVYTQHILMQRFFDPSNRVNCVTPFDGGRKLLYGTDNGIWISDTKMSADGAGRVTTKPVRVINVSSVSQIDVIEEYNMLLAMSEKTLYTWPLDCLETSDPIGNERRARKVIGHINFYKVGLGKGKILVCTAKNGSSTSTLKVLEPADPTPRGKRPPLRKLLRTQAEGLAVLKEMVVSSEIVSINFLTNNLCVGCTKGFEIMSLDTYMSESVLALADTALDFVTRRETVKPIAIYRLQSEFLLNYSDFSFYVNASGWLSRPKWIIHWEGLPQGFAMSYPYIIGFEPSFVEIRHMETGEIVRVITGENIRFLHENTREIMYAFEDENGYDVVASLDFWQKEKKQGGSGGVKKSSLDEKEGE